MRINPTDTVLDRLRIRAAGAAQAAAAADELHRASWPSRSDNSWVFIRSIHVRSHKTRLGQQAALIARDLAAGAVDGRLPAADAAQAVRFASLEQMLAWLLADIAAGRAHLRWFWQRWLRLFRLSASQAIAQVLSEHSEHMGGVVEELHAMAALSRVWQTLAGDDARQLLLELSRVTQINLYAAADVRLVEHDGKTAVPAKAAARIAQAAHWPDIVRRWSAPLSAIDSQDSRFQLAAALIAVQKFPVYLTRDARKYLPAVAVALHTYLTAADVLSVRAEEPARAPLVVSGSKVHTAATRAAIEATGNAAPDDDETSDTKLEERIPPAMRFNSPATPQVVENAIERIVQIIHDQEKPNTIDILDSGIVPESAMLPEHQFHTGQGGVFYLINALNHPSVRSLIDAAGAWTDLPSGWAWLFRLGKALGLDLDDRVVWFFARETGLESVHQLGDIAELPLRDELVSLLSRLYARGNVWQPDLLRVAARVIYTATHVDVEFPESAVRLPVRLAGLDFNPGWVPWLGRVVTFHYVSVHDGGARE